MSLRTFRKTALAGMIAATCYGSFAHGEAFTINSNFELPAGTTLTSDEGDEYVLIVQGSVSVKVNGKVYNTSDNARAVLVYNVSTPTTGFGLFNGKAPLTIGADGGLFAQANNAHGLLLSDGTANNIVIRIDKSQVDGSISGHGTGAAIMIEDEVIGTLTFGEDAVLTGGIRSTGNTGALVLVSSADITGDNAVDFSQSAGKLNLTLQGGEVSGDIRASSTVTDDVLTVRDDPSKVGGILSYIYGNTYSSAPPVTIDGDIFEVDQVAFSQKGNFTRFTGQIRHAGGTAAVNLDGKLEIGYGITSQTFEGNYSQSQSSVLKALVSGGNTVTPALVVAGDVTIADGSSILLIPTKALVQGQQATTIQVLSAGGDYNVDETNLNIENSVVADMEVSDANLDNILQVTLTPKATTGEEIIDPVVFNDDTSEEANNAHNTVASVTTEEGLEKLADEARSNNAGIAQEANVILQGEAVSQILRRLGVKRSRSGQSYGSAAEGKGFWVQFLRSESTQDASDNDNGDRLFGFDAAVNGMTLGLEQEQGDFTLGGAVTLANADIDKSDSLDNSSITNYQLSFYGSWERDQWFMDSVLNLGRSSHERNRFIDGFASTALTSDFHSVHYGIKAIGGMSHYMNGLEVQPMLGFNYTRIHTDSYDEEDPGKTGFAQSVDSQTYQKAELGVGVAVSKVLQVAGGELEPYVSLMAWHDFKGDQVETTASYLIDPDREITIEGADPVKNSWQASVSLSYRRDNNTSIIAGYNRTQKSDFHSDNFYLRMKYDF